mgnify:FL=1
MKKYLKEIITLLIQILIFYIFPLFAGPTDIMGMVVLMLLATLFLSLILTIISKEKIKYLYPLVVAIIFIPSIFIYYNESALIHSLWYLVSSLLGTILGIITNKVFSKK